GGAPTDPQKLPPLNIPIQTFLHNLGLTGATAYMGLMKTASAKPGDIVFVSAAAGAVGSAVVQIAKKKGMTVIGSAGGAAKCEWVRSLGADACVDYKAGNLLEQLSAAAPNGIDVYFDNVGGDHLDLAPVAHDFLDRALMQVQRPQQAIAVFGFHSARRMAGGDGVHDVALRPIGRGDTGAEQAGKAGQHGSAFLEDRVLGQGVMLQYQRFQVVIQHMGVNLGR
ncbi:MAG: hypothetical protein CFE34_20040, partial [Rhodobacteraceae bacterium PARR1]